MSKYNAIVKTITAGTVLDLTGQNLRIAALQPITIMPTYKARNRKELDTTKAHKTAVGTWVNDDTNPATLQGYTVADCNFIRCISGTIECILEDI